MTIVAIWRQDDYPTQPIWVCSDSRISDGHGTPAVQGEPLPLLRHSPKIFPLSVISVVSGSTPEVVGFRHAIGLAYAGSSLFAVNLYAALAPILTNLRGERDAGVAIRDVAELAQKFLCEFAMAYGAKYGRIAPFEIAVFGFCKVESVRRVFVLRPTQGMGPEGAGFQVQIVEIDFSTPEYVFLMGSHKPELHERIVAIRRGRPTRSSWRYLAPRDAIRQFIHEDRYPDVGGTVQLAQANSDGFSQYMDLDGEPVGPPTNFRYLGFDLNAFGSVGACWFSMPAVM